jgi:S1-C subfamily serine protease
MNLSKVKNNFKGKLNTLFSTLEKAVNPFTKIAVALLVVTGAGLTGAYLFREKSDITASTVMITSMNERSGGSGVIVGNNDNFSYVLTNKHVCGVAAKGGLVKTTTGQNHTIISYKESNTHDLCLISVLAQLKGKVTLAKAPPQMYERATVSGHPALLPNVLTEGHFSGNKVIDVFLGMRPCTEEEKEDEKTAGICFFFRGLPVVETYETVLVTATIMPGSSGSAIYNSSKELSALVFAGSGDIGYAFAVPYEYVSYFLNKEVETILPKKPSYRLDVTASDEENSSRKLEKAALAKCEKEDITNSVDKNKIEHICELIVRDYNWRK